ncbi:hypothetical protein LTR37_021263 [Vermiconidia calcicola]|uniref:Uncharacterized protein n=1 Tax=Vermiconidia calcicola TaxID=1690605 RepID=A0ACC3MC15_9PEZI|nr:hypothetical protein LTR37_021263 [Vermiconidia calcicola]
MADDIPQRSGNEKTVHVPEWEHEAAGGDDGKAVGSRPQASIRTRFTAELDSVIPPHRRYLGLSRNFFLWTLLALVLALLALIVGFAVGLSEEQSQNLPLPSSTETFTGDLTYFETGLGACGETNDRSDHIVSISHFVFDAAGSSSSTGGNSNANPLCNRMIRASRYDEEHGERRSIDLRVADRCTGCEPEDIDVTVGAFSQLASIDLGRTEVRWAWLE